MKVKIFIVMCMALLITMTAQVVFAAGSLKLAVSNQTIESGEDLGAVLLLNGDGNYDVYAAITGGILQNALLMFTSGGGLAMAAADLPKLMDNVNIGSLEINDKIIELLPKFSVDDGASLAGTYYFYVALCTPGQFDFIVVDMVTVTIE